MRAELLVPGLPAPASHYAHVVVAGPGRLVFVSGCVPLDAGGRLVGGGDVVAQTRQVFENLARSLAAAGATFADVCKVTVYLRDGKDRDRINTVRGEYFGASRPASTLIQVAGFSRDDVLVEIEATAVVPWSGGNEAP